MAGHDAGAVAAVTKSTRANSEFRSVPAPQARSRCHRSGGGSAAAEGRAGWRCLQGRLRSLQVQQSPYGDNALQGQDPCGQAEHQPGRTSARNVTPVHTVKISHMRTPSAVTSLAASGTFFASVERGLNSLVGLHGRFGLAIDDDVENFPVLGLIGPAVRDPRPDKSKGQDSGEHPAAGSDHAAISFKAGGWS